MSRLTNTILSGAYSNGDDGALTLDLEYGGQFGYNPKLGLIDSDGKIKSEWISNKAYITNNVIPILIEAPRFFGLMPNPEKWTGALKSLMETHVRTIEGLTSTLTVETTEHPIGGAGEMMEEPTKTLRERTVMSKTFVEKGGRSISRFFEKWITYGIMDPDTERPLVSTLPNIGSDVDMLPDWYGCTMLYMEPDIMHKKIVHAWLRGYMFPKTSGEILGKFDKVTAGDIVELSVDFAGFTQYNHAVNIFAQNILDNINIINANPYTAPAFVDEVQPNIDAIERGYKPDAQNLADSAP